jgi:hypothetical protein
VISKFGSENSIDTNNNSNFCSLILLENTIITFSIKIITKFYIPMEVDGGFFIK